jgi:hypothetical protein
MRRDGIRYADDTLTLWLFMEGVHTLSRNRSPWYSLGYLLVVGVLILLIILLVLRLV